MATVTSAQSGLWSSGSTWSGGSVPVDGDDVVISAGHEVQVDSGCDHEGSSITLTGIVIQGGATPGMLFWKDDSTNGTGNIRSSGDISGTHSTNNGRLLANLDGQWDTETPLGAVYSAVIRLSGTATLECDDLDVRMRCTEPEHLRARTYGNKYDFDGASDVDPSANTIDLGTTPPSEGTLVMVTTAAGTLPRPLQEDTLYYVRQVSGTTCKLAQTNSDSTIIDLTSAGSGTCTLYTGYSGGSDTVNVLDDVTGDIWAVGDAAALVNVGPQDYDQQRLTLSAINSGSITLSAAVDSDQNPGSSIWLVRRNCSILHSGTSTSQEIVSGGERCVFGEIRGTAGSGGTFYCVGLGESVGHTVSVVSSCYQGSAHGFGHIIALIVVGRSGTRWGSGGIIETLTGFRYGLEYGTDFTVKVISGCTYGISDGSSHKIKTVSGCNSAVNRSSRIYIENLSGNYYDSNNAGRIYTKNGIIPVSPIFNIKNRIGLQSKLFSEHHAGIYGAHRIFQTMGNATKVTAGEGSPTPDKRPGGSDYLIELSNLQSNLDYDPYGLIAWDDDQVKVWARAGVSKTYRFYVQSTFGLDANDLVLSAEYLDSAVDTGTEVVKSMVKDTYGTHHGTIHGGVEWEGGTTECLHFDGSSGYVDFGDVSAFDFTTNDNFAFSFRVYINDTPTDDEFIMGKYHWPDRGWAIVLGHTRRLRFITLTASDTYTTRSDAISTGAWHHVVINYSAGVVTFYIEEVDSTYSQDSHQLDAATGYPLLSGKYGSSYFFDGKLSEVRIYNKTLSSSERSSLYNDPDVILNDGIISHWPCNLELISARSGITDWSQYLEVGLQPTRDGWVRFNMSLFKYSSGGQVFIDPAIGIIQQ
mgnify:CR=1 FL=1